MPMPILGGGTQRPVTEQPGTPLQRMLYLAVKRHAMKHYEEDGWDYIVESYDRRELLELVGKSRTVKTAIDKAHREVKLLNDRRRDIQATAW